MNTNSELDFFLSIFYSHSDVKIADEGLKCKYILGENNLSLYRVITDLTRSLAVFVINMGLITLM